MDILIKTLELENFKGIRNLIINFGKDTLISGENGSGKTTIIDAFTWLFFNKDSKGNTKFNIKTLDSTGKEINKLDHVVTAVLSIDGKEKIFSKKYAENWKRVRGQAAPTDYSTHATTYLIDDIPVTKKDYDAQIDAIIDEKVFKLVTNPNYFNGLHWEEQREILFNILGEVSTEEILNSNNELMALESLLEDGEENFIKKIKSQISKINKELETIPLRIDECNKNIIDKDFNALKTRKAFLEGELSKIDIDIQELHNSENLNNLKSKLADIKAEYMTKQNDLNNSIERPRQILESEYRKIKDEISSKKMRIEFTLDTIGRAEKDVDYYSREREKLVNEYKELNSKTFNVDDIKKSCPTCGQPLDPKVLKAKLEDMKANFNSDLGRRKEYIKNEGVKMAQHLKAAEEKLKDSKNKLEIIKDSKNKLEVELKEIEEKLKAIPKNSALENAAEYENKINDLQAQIDNYKNTNQLSEFTSLKNKYNEEIKTLINEIAAESNNKNLLVRMEELNTQTIELSNKLSELQEKEYLGEEFIRAKVNLYEDKINNKFNKVKFVLFNQQVNGGIKETCECSVNGVPYKDLNNAMKINAGIEIINVLCDYYRINAPIFIDNSESVNELENTKSQIIKLRVSKDKKLKIEV